MSITRRVQPMTPETLARFCVPTALGAALNVAPIEIAYFALRKNLHTGRGGIPFRGIAEALNLPIVYTSDPDKRAAYNVDRRVREGWMYGERYMGNAVSRPTLARFLRERQGTPNMVVCVGSGGGRTHAVYYRDWKRTADSWSREFRRGRVRSYISVPVDQSSRNISILLLRSV